MEYPSKNDFFLKFKGIFNGQGVFQDYILVSVSNSFYSATGLRADRLIGERVSKIITENDNTFGLEELYNIMIPNTSRKYILFINHLKRWYIVNLFSDESDYLLLVYNDITKLKEQNNLLTNQDNIRTYYKDYLTDLYTRDFFNEELKRLNTKRQLPLSVIAGDVNSLKLINDAFGHDMGDKVLKRVSEIMKSTFRKEDIISRIGGDEFAILLPSTSEDAALDIVNRLKQKCINNPLDFLVISISFGVATKVKEDEDINKILKRADNRMYYSKIMENKAAKKAMIKHLKDKLEEISFETKEHYKRLEELTMMLANRLNLSQEEKEELKLLCEFHDIGKIGVPRQILQKQGSLNSEEWDDIKRHSEIGYQILKETNKDLAINDLILVHHERWDGKGYPGFLKNDEIPLVVRIFSVADAYEAMVNDRPFKSRISKEAALQEIKDKAGTQFDPNLAHLFVEMMLEKHIA